METRPGWWEETPEKLTKLEIAFLKDLSDEQACVYAGITPRQLYYYQEINPEFVGKKLLLKENVKARAKINVAIAIESNDLDTSKWYLERKLKNEFGTRQENENKGDIVHRVIIEDGDQNSFVASAQISAVN